jgi:hypothetical protein
MPRCRDAGCSPAVVDLYCASYTNPPQAVTLDIDDTVDRACCWHDRAAISPGD